MSRLVQVRRDGGREFQILAAAMLNLFLSVVYTSLSSKIVFWFFSSNILIASYVCYCDVRLSHLINITYTQTDP